jgi:hypothetical protein
MAHSTADGRCDFPGWTAEIDGEQVPITPSDPHGLITFPVPAGDHDVRVYLASTPARDLGIGLTIASFIGVVALAVIISRAGFFTAQAQLAKTQPVVSLLPERGTIFALSAAFFLSLILALIYLRKDVGWVESPPGQALLAQHQIVYHLGENIDLLGYDLNGDRFAPGDQVELRVYWYAHSPIPYGYASFVHISTGGPPLAQADKQNPAGRPTKAWSSDGYIRDDYRIQLPPDMPAGEYTIYIGLYTCDTLPAGECGNGERLLVTDAANQSVGDALPLQTIIVR